MSDNKKVMTVTIMHIDLYDSTDYTGVHLNLPTSRNEIQDAMDRARIRGGQLYKIEECFNMQGEKLGFIPDDLSVEELNFLAHRMGQMNEHDKIAFKGCTIMGDGHPSMQFLINLTYNLDNVHAVPVKNDQELGKFYVDNDFLVQLTTCRPNTKRKYWSGWITGKSGAAIGRRRAVSFTTAFML